MLLLSPTAGAEKTPANPDGESAAQEQEEPSSAAAPEPTVEEKTDDEGVDSNKTSVESLKETNVNNSNSRSLFLQRGLYSQLVQLHRDSLMFWQFNQWTDASRDKAAGLLSEL